MGNPLVRGCVALCLALASAAAAWAEAPGVERVRFHRLGVEQGLSQATARVFAQDAAGFMWIGTQDGLNRFDGHEFEVFRHHAGRDGGLGDNHVTALAVDAEGALWIGTQAGGLAVRDPVDGMIRREVVLPTGGNGALPAITALLADAELGLLLGTGDGRVLRRGSTGWQLVDLGFDAAPGPIRSLRAGRGGDLLVAARGGAWRCPAGGPCTLPLRDSRGHAIDAHDLIAEPDGSLWLGSSERGLFHFDADGRLLVRLHRGASSPLRIADNAVRRLLVDRRKRLWVATNDGLDRLAADRRSAATWRQRQGVGGLPASRVHALFEDRDGRVWVGTWTEGLALFDPATEVFTSVSADPQQPGALPFDVVTAVWADPDGSLWLGLSPSRGLVHFDLQRGVRRHYLHAPADPRSLSHNYVQHIVRDRRGALWVATQGGGLNRLRGDGGFDRFQHDPADPGSLGSDSVLHLSVDGDNTLWIATADAGLDRRCDGCAAFEHFRHDPDDPQSLAADSLNSSFEDSAGRFWVAARPGGLHRMERGSGRFRRYTADSGDPFTLSSNTLTHLFEDRGGRLWIGTQGGGLNLLVDPDADAPRFRRFTRLDGLAADAIGGMFEDDRGRLWMSTTSGLSRFDPATWSVENFGGRDGPQGSGYFIGAQARLPDGRLAFGGLRGLTVFDPADVGERGAPGAVRITRILSQAATDLDVDPLALADRVRSEGLLHLRHPARDFTVEFSALAFTGGDAVRYRHRLDGVDADWVDTDPRRRLAAYTNLPEGEYRFRVLARSGDLSGPEAGFRLRVDPPPLANPLGWAALALLGGALLGLLGWLVRSRLRDRRRAAERLRESEERLKLALWGTGDELWDLDLLSNSMRRINPLPFLAAPGDVSVADVGALSRFIHPEDRRLPGAALRAHLRGETEVFEVAYRALDNQGHWRWLRSRGRVVERDRNGHARRVAGTVGDISELKQNELALQSLNQALEERVEARTVELTRANEALQGTVSELRLAQRQLVDAEKMAALGGLVAGVAHEINTPLGVSVTAASHLQGETQRLQRLLEGGELTRADLDAYHAVARESSELILRNLQRASTLVRSFKQVAVDQSSEERRHIVLAQYVEEVLTSLRPALKRTRHRIIVDCPADLGFVTLPGAIYQVLVNLIMNSLIHAFGPEDEGEIRIEAARKPDHVLLTYADNGRGMPEEARARIFEPFFTTRRGQGGSGLGMHIVFNLVTQALGGSIECDSAAGQGVYFSIRIPIAAE